MLDPAWAVGTLGLGGCLLLVHMYVAPLKRFMQALWAAGAAGSLALAATQHGDSVAAAVFAHRPFVWAVGPLFAAFTGLCFKEGACYGKPESFALCLVWPTLLLGHLCGAPTQAEAPLLGAAAVLLTLFAARKYTQPVRDDIGDKSVFAFMELTPAAQEAAEAALAAREWGGRGAPSTAAEDEQ